MKTIQLDSNTNVFLTDNEALLVTGGVRIHGTKTDTMIALAEKMEFYARSLRLFAPPKETPDETPPPATRRVRNSRPRPARAKGLRERAR